MFSRVSQHFRFLKAQDIWGVSSPVILRDHWSRAGYHEPTLSSGSGSEGHTSYEELLQSGVHHSLPCCPPLSIIPSASPSDYKATPPQCRQSLKRAQAAWVQTNIMTVICIRHRSQAPPDLRGSDFPHLHFSRTPACPLLFGLSFPGLALYLKFALARAAIFSCSELALDHLEVHRGLWFLFRASVIFIPTCFPSSVASVPLPCICHC